MRARRQGGVKHRLVVEFCSGSRGFDLSGCLGFRLLDALAVLDWSVGTSGALYEPALGVAKGRCLSPNPCSCIEHDV